MKYLARYKSDGPFIATQGATKGRRYEIIEDASGTEAASMEAFATANHYRHAPSGTYVPQEVALWAVKAECAARTHGGGTLAAAIDAAIANLTGETKRNVEAVWTDGNTVLRRATALLALQAALSLDAATVDAIFIAAYARQTAVTRG